MCIRDSDSDLTRIAPGETLEFAFNESGQFSGLRLKRDALRATEILLNDEGQFTASTIQTPTTTRPIVKVGQITTKQSSLYLAGQSIQMSDKLIMELASLFQWDISFALDLRQGDQFFVIYEGIYTGHTDPRRRYSCRTFFKHGSAVRGLSLHRS